MTLFDVMPSKGKALADLNWYEFEQFSSNWVRQRGFEEVARTAIDAGVDITALKSGIREPEYWAIQCKHWAQKIGPAVVRELEGARKLRGADRAMLITSSTFTREAIETADKLKIELIDGDTLRGASGIDRR